MMMMMMVTPHPHDRNGLSQDNQSTNQYESASQSHPLHQSCFPHLITHCSRLTACHKDRIGRHFTSTGMAEERDVTTHPYLAGYYPPK